MYLYFDLFFVSVPDYMEFILHVTMFPTCLPWLGVLFTVRYFYGTEFEKFSNTFLCILGYRGYCTNYFIPVHLPSISSQTFLYPLRASENRTFYDAHRGFRNVTLSLNGFRGKSNRKVIKNKSQHLKCIPRRQ